MNLSNYILSNDLIDVYGHMMVSTSLGRAGADPINVRGDHLRTRTSKSQWKYDCCTISEHTHATPTLLVRPGLNELILSTVVDKILHAVVHGEDEVEQRVSARLQERGR